MSDEQVEVQHDLVFGRTDRGENLTADVYLPHGEGEHPAVLLIHGGAWRHGAKEEYMQWGSLLARAGFLVVAINYRLSSPGHATWPGNLDDVRQAFRWLVRQAPEYSVDPRNIGVMGDSAGGHLGALLTLTHYAQYTLLAQPEDDESDIRAMVGVYGVYDVAPPAGAEQRDLYTLAVPEMLGATLQEALGVYRQASASTYIAAAASTTRFKTRFLLSWGDADDVVPPSVSEQFARQLIDNGAAVRTVVIPGAGHNWIAPMPDRPGGTLQDYPNTVFAPQVIAFLSEALAPNVPRE